MSSLYAMRCYCTGNVSWFRQHSRSVFWKISTLATQGVLENMDKGVENVVKSGKGYYYLIEVNSFSKWPEVHRSKNPTIEMTIKFQHELFARFGVVDTLVFDNGSQFTSGKFRDFC